MEALEKMRTDSLALAARPAEAEDDGERENLWNRLEQGLRLAVEGTALHAAAKILREAEI